MQEDEDEHQVAVDSDEDFVARVRSRRIHFVELYELKQNVGEGYKAEDDCAETNRQASVTLNKSNLTIETLTNQSIELKLRQIKL